MHEFWSNLFLEVGKKLLKDTVGANWANLNIKQLLDDFIELQNNYGITVNFLRWDNDM